MLLIAILFLPFAASLLLALAVDRPRWVHFGIAGGASAIGLALLIACAPGVLAGAPIAVEHAWVPAIGLNFSLWLDPLGLLFAGLILGIGLLVILYAQGYLEAGERTGRFLSFLLLFQGAMIGIALSGNVLLMLVFWELTSLASFLLIGFWRDRADARQGARMALAVTGGGGIALIGGMLLLGQAAGSYDLPTILERGALVQASPLYPAILLLVLLGAFTKSAQFPFHFWLPHAMAAPTPVSAYLHSATMVKAGVFLLARLWPVLAGTDLWFGMVVGTGLVTMLFGAAVALFRNDLKAILAYSTISQLGLMVMLIGFGTGAAMVAAILHILNHAAFKAALFMNAGIVDHETGTRDIRRLGGLAALMPITATLGTIAAAAMAGVPPLGGFLSKEMMLEQSAHTAIAGAAWPIALFATIAAALSVAYSVRYAIGLYFGRRGEGGGGHPHDPGLAMIAPSALLVLAAIAIGLLPMTIAAPLVRAAANAATGGAVDAIHLSLWHGVTPALGLSIAAFALGAALLSARRPIARWLEGRAVPDAGGLFHGGLARIVAVTRRASRAIHAPSLQRALFVLFAVALACAVDGGLAGGGVLTGDGATLPATPVAIILWLVLVAATIAVVVVQRQRYLALLFVGVVGLVVALAFVHLSAPDLALTQIAVEVVTILLMLLALHLLPQAPRRLSSRPRELRDGMIAIAVGIAAGLGAWGVMTRGPRDPISAFHWANSVSGGGGANVVNVTIVDFRGFDTLGEIIVLGIAGLVIYALLETAARGVPGRRLREWRGGAPVSPERHPMMFVMATRILLPLALLVGVHIFLRGHNSPGGGFVAALVFAIAILLQYLASGFDWTDQRRRIGEHALIATGVLIAVATGLGSLAFGAPFLSTSFGHFHLPVIGDFELATAMLFDGGVACVVVGAVMLALEQLAHVAQRAARHDPAGDAEPLR